jgi:glycosyltransferase involved in cell wall biosynthesis
LRYYVELRRGIATARNTAVARVGDDTEFVAFIDDDEVPEPQWLDQLLSVQAAHSADVVAGPALPHFLPDTPEWIIRGRHFDHARYETGDRLRSASTNNCLVRHRVFRELSAGFAVAFDLTGGEDRHFFDRARRAGFNMVWCDEAVVKEWIPLSRANLTWILERFYRMGTSWSHIALDLSPAVVAWPPALVRGGTFTCAGLLLLPWGLIRGRHLLVRHLRYICYGVGVFAGLIGLRSEEYRRIHSV